LGFLPIEGILQQPINKEMNPKLFVTLAIAVSLFCSSSPQSACADAYTSASYGLSHSKKAFNAHNFDHQKYYAGRALEALEKARGLVGECGCAGAMNSIEDGMKNLEEALDPADWKMGRYYSKRAVENTYSLLENLDLCSMSEDSPAKQSGTDGNNEIRSSASRDLVEGHTEEAIREFEATAREQLEQLNEKIAELCQRLGCDNPLVAMEQAHTELPKGRVFSSLEEAMDHYKAQTIRAYEQAATAMKQCGNYK
jgi:hypothetical protein